MYLTTHVLSLLNSAALIIWSYMWELYKMSTWSLISKKLPQMKKSGGKTTLGLFFIMLKKSIISGLFRFCWALALSNSCSVNQRSLPRYWNFFKSNIYSRKFTYTCARVTFPNVFLDFLFWSAEHFISKTQW